MARKDTLRRDKRFPFLTADEVESLQPFMAAKDIAVLFDVTPVAARNWARRVNIPSLKVGRKLMYPSVRVLEEISEQLYVEANS